MLETRPSGAEIALFWRNFATPCATFSQNSTKRCFDSVGSVPERCSVGVPQMALGQCA